MMVETGRPGLHTRRSDNVCERLGSRQHWNVHDTQYHPNGYYYRPERGPDLRDRSNTKYGLRDTITRTDGSWSDDGFDAGGSITVTNASSSTNDQTYIIAAISADGKTLTIDESGQVTASSGDNSARFDLNDQIIRAAGSWTADGYGVGGTIIVKNSYDGNGDGVGDNDGSYTIGSISADGTIITLTDSNVVTADSSDTTATCKFLGAGQVPLRMRTTGDVNFVNNGTSGTGDTITREDGSWSTEGFQSGDKITISYSQAVLTDADTETYANNDTTGATQYTIASISQTARQSLCRIRESCKIRQMMTAA